MPDTTPHEPTESTRLLVSNMIAYGIPQESVARCINIDPKTLRKYYRDEIDTSSEKLIAEVGNYLIDKCRSGDTSSIVFFLKTRGKWSETNNVNNRYVDEDGKDLHKADKDVLSKLGINVE